MTDTLINENGEEVMLDEPTGWELPPKGFEVKDDGFLAPEEDGSHVEVKVDQTAYSCEPLHL
jgi:aconitate hydratase